MRKARISAALKGETQRRAGGRCEYCKSPDNISPLPFHAEHIIPESAGGATELDNLAWSCGCNGHKYDKQSGIDPQTDEEVPLFNPRAQLWEEHFEWSADFTEITGITPVGRATVDALKMNRDNLVRLRRMLKAQGEHPAT